MTKLIFSLVRVNLNRQFSIKLMGAHDQSLLEGIQEGRIMSCNAIQIIYFEFSFWKRASAIHHTAQTFLFLPFS